jgi:hypothetical protein
MKRIFKVLGLAAVIAALLVVALAGTALAAESTGPAPNSGDGISDGSGFDGPNGPIGSAELGSGPIGPAPNSGDGISDGSGF